MPNQRRLNRSDAGTICLTNHGFEPHPLCSRSLRGFSASERKNLGIAQALVNYPDLLILDEPDASRALTQRSYPKVLVPAPTEA
jgi:ABC-type molybdenum transport system ATPase subunit/photorepair protein PhrA